MSTWATGTDCDVSMTPPASTATATPERLLCACAQAPRSPPLRRLSFSQHSIAQFCWSCRFFPGLLHSGVWHIGERKRAGVQRQYTKDGTSPGVGTNGASYMAP